MRRSPLALLSCLLLAAASAPAAGIAPIDPAQIPGTIARYDAAVAACVGSPADQATIAQCKDLSGNGRDLTPSGVKYKAGIANGQPALDMYQASLVNNSFFPGGDFTIVGVMRNQGDGFEVLWDQSQNPAQLWWNGSTSSDQAISTTVGTTRSVPRQIAASSGWFFFAYQGGSGVTYPGAPANTQMRHQTTNNRSAINSQDGGAPAAGAPLRIGDRGSATQIGYLAVIGRKTTIPELAGIHAGLATRFGLDLPAGPAVIVLGNSTSSYNEGLAAPLNLFTAGAGQDFIYHNMSIPGSDANSLPGQFPEIASIVDFYVAAGRKVLFVTHYGHNDWNSGDPNQVVNFMKLPWFQAQRSKGVRILGITPTTREDGTSEAARQTQIAWMKANWQNYYDGLVDLSADPYVGTSPRSGIAGSVFADFVHPNKAGLNHIASRVAPALLALAAPPAAASTDPGAANVLSGVGYTIAGAAKTGSYVPPASTDPGAANVLSGVAYTIAGAARTGTYVPAAGPASTDPGAANVRLGTTYTIAGSALTGTYDPVSGRYSDPGAANVRLGTSYQFAGSTVAGTLVVSAGSGSGGSAGLSDADAQKVAAAILARTDVEGGGRTLAQTLRAISAATFGRYDLATPGAVIYRLPTGQEQFRYAGSTRTNSDTSHAVAP